MATSDPALKVLPPQCGDAGLTSHSTLLTERQAAALLGISPATLQRWRSTGAVRLGFVKLGKAVRYRADDLRQFVEASVRSTTA